MVLQESLLLSAGADITLVGISGTVTVSQAGNTISIDSTDTNDVTKLAANSETLAFGDFRFEGSGATTLTTSTSGTTKVITISSVNSDTGASLTASGGLIQSGVDFQLKNSGNFTGKYFDEVGQWQCIHWQTVLLLTTDQQLQLVVTLFVTGTS